VVPESVSARDLDAESRRRLASLSKDNADRVARHLVYAGSMMDVDPELSYEHARAACRSAARIDIVREALGLSAYLTGRYSEALRELRTFRRMTDDYAHAAIEADSERGLGRPEKALAFISEIPLKRLDPESRIELALVTSGARADAGDSEGGLAVLEKIIPDQTDWNQYQYPGEEHYRAVERWPDAEAYLPGGDRTALWNCDAHLKATLIGSSETFEVADGKLGVGTTGYCYFVDFDRTRARTRKCIIVVMGE